MNGLVCGSGAGIKSFILHLNFVIRYDQAAFESAVRNKSKNSRIYKENKDTKRIVAVLNTHCFENFVNLLGV
jgi:hypothetical protein